MAFSSAHHQDVFQYSYPPQNGYYISDGSSPLGTGDESNFWSSSPRSDSPSPSAPPFPGYPYFGRAPRPDFRQAFAGPPLADGEPHAPVPYVRVVKRRTTANKKERRRTQSINNAYADLRDCIPNVPPDTKLSKIKTLRLATSYINYLVKALETDDTAGGFTAELAAIGRRPPPPAAAAAEGPPQADATEDLSKARKAKGRTGWPQHVWALELEQDPQL